ncbi:hypothetical protein GBA52_014530, partial [Prunus armeniaca]
LCPCTHPLREVWMLQLPLAEESLFSLCLLYEFFFARDIPGFSDFFGSLAGIARSNNSSSLFKWASKDNSRTCLSLVSRNDHPHFSSHFWLVEK